MPGLLHPDTRETSGGSFKTFILPAPKLKFCRMLRRGDRPPEPAMRVPFLTRPELRPPSLRPPANRATARIKGPDIFTFFLCKNSKQPLLRI